MMSRYSFHVVINCHQQADNITIHWKHLKNETFAYSAEDSDSSEEPTSEEPEASEELEVSEESEPSEELELSDELESSEDPEPSEESEDPDELEASEAGNRGTLRRHTGHSRLNLIHSFKQSVWNMCLHGVTIYLCVQTLE
ncbi:hypothetical protein DIURU_002518 [Diutina rugosa]|uniref:Uncharacterized protein n=1 Tax=Diutina rugosa TaxID=5481 RepID=A0A642UPW3_DIURU|nr:uncharacterized protein DIURU_002518 [Diutina rugosa]KAA8903231.1 hypothetical protein DIURU_002518 [Diutina rugosa]